MLWTTASRGRSIVLGGLTAGRGTVGAPPRTGRRRDFFGLGLGPVRLGRHQNLLTARARLGRDVLHDLDLLGDHPARLFEEAEAGDDRLDGQRANDAREERERKGGTESDQQRSGMNAHLRPPLARPCRGSVAGRPGGVAFSTSRWSSCPLGPPPRR